MIGTMRNTMTGTEMTTIKEANQEIIWSKSEETTINLSLTRNITDLNHFIDILFKN